MMSVAFAPTAHKHRASHMNARIRAPAKWEGKCTYKMCILVELDTGWHPESTPSVYSESFTNISYFSMRFYSEWFRARTEVIRVCMDRTEWHD